MPAGRGGTIARNRRASLDYELGERVEAGLALLGSEVKALREGRAAIDAAWIGEAKGELFLFNAEIGQYAPAAAAGHEPRRARKLLVRRRERARLLADTRESGMTIVPLSLHFNPRGLAKLEVAPGRGRRKVDKRRAIREREWRRRRQRLSREARVGRGAGGGGGSGSRGGGGPRGGV